MADKRLFQVLDEMNVNDDVNKTETCACCFDVVGANKVKQGGHVTMGVPAEAVLKIFLGEYQPMLVLLDKKVYDRIEKQPVEDKLQTAEASVKARGETITRLNNRLTNLETALKGIADRPTTGEVEISKNDGAVVYNAMIEEAREALTPKPATDERRL